MTTVLLASLPLLLVYQLHVPGTRAANQSLPTGYVAHPEFGVAYKVYDGNVSWTEASELCVLDGAKLAVIDSAQKLEFATRQPMRRGVRHVGIQWVGDKSSGMWVSTDKEDVLPSIPWAPNEPSPNIGGLNRAMVGWRDTIDGLISGHKSIFFGDYICELPLPGYVKETYVVPKGYVAYREIGVAYKVHARNVSWNVARKRCLLEGAQLAVIDSASKLDYALRQQKSGRGRMHVGIRRVNDQWVRASNGKSLPSILFGNVAPASRGFDCGMLENIALVSGSCNFEPREFICEIPLPAPMSTTNFTSSTLPDGYVAHPDVSAAYKVYGVHVAWPEARKRCRRDGAHLALIDSFKKLKYVMRQMDKSEKYIHVGIRRLRGTEKWVSVSNGTPVSSIPWAEDQPNGSGKNCTMVKLAEHGLISAACEFTGAGYACERPFSTT